MDFIKALSHDRENPTSRINLAKRLGISERETRRRIAQARRSGVWIVSLLTGGYYITDSPEEWNAFCEQERRRAVATFKKAAAMQTAEGEQLEII